MTTKTAAPDTERWKTQFGSLDDYDKGRVEVIDDDPKHYTFSNMFEVASISRPYQQVAVGKNSQHVVRGLHADRRSRPVRAGHGWRGRDAADQAGRRQSARPRR